MKAKLFYIDFSTAPPLVSIINTVRKNPKAKLFEIIDVENFEDGTLIMVIADKKEDALEAWRNEQDKQWLEELDEDGKYYPEILKWDH